MPEILSSSLYFACYLRFDPDPRRDRIFKGVFLKPYPDYYEPQRAFPESETPGNITANDVYFGKVRRINTESMAWNIAPEFPPALKIHSEYKV